MTLVVNSVEHVLAELDSIYSGDVKHVGDNIHVCCPFHDERTPSCSINISLSADVAVGTFYCYGCGEHGGWNKFAAQAGLKPIKNWQHFESNSSSGKSKFDKRTLDLIGRNNLTIQRLFDEVGNSVIPWPEHKEWRGYSGNLIRRVEGYCFNDRAYDELQLVLPVYTNGRYRGGVRAFFEKQKNGLSYLTTKGGWVKSYGLLGYDFLQKRNCFNCKSIALVEGPRDWLRLIRNKIPALAILGALMFDEKKLTLIMALGVTKIYVIPDNDPAGLRMYHNIVNVVESSRIGVEVILLNLPKAKDAKGKLIKMDPDNAPKKIIDKIKKLIVG
jgi:hypothetical protein